MRIERGIWAYMRFSPLSQLFFCLLPLPFTLHLPLPFTCFFSLSLVAHQSYNFQNQSFNSLVGIDSVAQTCPIRVSCTTVPETIAPRAYISVYCSVTHMLHTFNRLIVQRSSDKTRTEDVVASTLRKKQAQCPCPHNTPLPICWQKYNRPQLLLFLLLHNNHPLILYPLQRRRRRRRRRDPQRLRICSTAFNRLD